MPAKHPARRSRRRRRMETCPPGQIDEMGEARLGHLPAIGCLYAREYLQERGLARAIRADEPQLLICIETQADAVEQHLQTVGLADGLDVDEKIGCHETRGSESENGGRYALTSSAAPAGGWRWNCSFLQALGQRRNQGRP